MNNLPIIAIVGRPNVGKSSLFNRLIGRRHAIVAEEAGTTRDRIAQKFKCNGYETTIIDTGGIQDDQKNDIEANVQMQAKIAISDADVIIFVTDSVSNLTVDDFKITEILRRSKKNIILVANKCDNSAIAEENIYNIYELGFGEPIPISAIHNLGIDKLKKTIAKELKNLHFETVQQKENKVGEKEVYTNLCILGKPNAGKSSLINSLLGDDKLIVSEIPGTTRDSIDTLITYEDKKYNLIDTAGIRRRGRVERGIEKFSVMRGISAIERADIVVLLIDGNDRISNQDCNIAHYALEETKGFIIAVNKIDLFEKGEDERERVIRVLQRKFSFIPWAPIIFVSAKNKKNIYELFALADKIMEERAKKIKTLEFNTFMQKITYKHLPASAKFKKPKFIFGNQVDIHPPKFLIFFKYAKNLHFSYPRYLENQIRKEYGFNGTAINLKIENKIESKNRPAAKAKAAAKAKLRSKR